MGLLLLGPEPGQPSFIVLVLIPLDWLRGVVHKIKFKSFTRRERTKEDDDDKETGDWTELMDRWMDGKDELEGRTRSGRQIPN